jgi:hypothetical protein
MEIWQVPYQLQIIEAGAGRSPGLHVSEVIRDLAVRGGQLDKKYVDADLSPEKIELGLAWEERVAKHHPEICFHPGEMQVDGISMSVDGISYIEPDEVSIFTVDGVGALHEFKLTWKSSKKDISGEWMWLTQIKSYLHGMSVTSKPKVTMRSAFLHVYWVNGDYGWMRGGTGSGSRYEIFGMRFTDLEIFENWSMITGHARRLKEGTVRVKHK